MDGPRSGASLDEVLAHFGVKGMKWGVRGTHPTNSGSSTSEDHRQATASKMKARIGGTKALSNKELQELVTRINLEQQYKKLNPSNKEKALKFVADILIGTGKQQAIKYANDVATKQVSALLNKKK